MNGQHRMKGIIMAGIAGLMLAGVPGTGAAESAPRDWYVRAAGGFSYIQDDDNNDFTDVGGEQNADASFDLGWGAAISVGRWFSERWRADLEWAYRSNGNDRIRLDDGRVADDGNYASTTLALNGFYHFSDGREVGKLSPYIGAGLAWVNEIDIDLEGGPDFGRDYEDLEDDGFGVQFMGGVSYRQSRSLRWDAELRWLYFGEADLDNGRGTRLDDLDYAPLTGFIGLSYEF